MGNRYRIGIDAGSTTIKFVVLDIATKDVAFSSYQRHFADIRSCLERQFREMSEHLGRDAQYSVCLTGSAGIGLSERSGLPFVQEVLAQKIMLHNSTKNVDISIFRIYNIIKCKNN